MCFDLLVVRDDDPASDSAACIGQGFEITLTLSASHTDWIGVNSDTGLGSYVPALPMF